MPHKVQVGAHVIVQPLQLNSRISHSALGTTQDWLQPVAEVSSCTHAPQVRLQIGPFVKDDDCSLEDSSSVGSLGAVEEHPLGSASAKASAIKARENAKLFDMVRPLVNGQSAPRLRQGDSKSRSRPRLLECAAILSGIASRPRGKRSRFQQSFA